MWIRTYDTIDSLAKIKLEKQMSKKIGYPDGVTEELFSFPKNLLSCALNTNLTPNNESL